MVKKQQSPCPVLFRTWLEIPVLGKLIPLCQLISAKHTGKTPNLSARGDSGSGKAAYHYHQLLPYLRLQEVMEDPELAFLLMNHMAVN